MRQSYRAPHCELLMDHITYDIKLLMEASNCCPLRDFRYFSRSSAWPAETEGIVDSGVDKRWLFGFVCGYQRADARWDD